MLDGGERKESTGVLDCTVAFRIASIKNAMLTHELLLFPVVLLQVTFVIKHHTALVI